VAAVDKHTLEAIDLKSGQRVHTIADLAEPQGVFYDASTNRIFVACAVDGVVKIYDGAEQLRKRTEGTGGLGFLDTNGNKTGDVVIGPSRIVSA
jgi:hypothetical protein